MPPFTQTLRDFLWPKKLESHEEHPAREEWATRVTFLLSALGTAVGLGQLWRFPTLAYKYGGGSFLIIHSVMIVLIGNCIFFFEVANGQYSGRNCLNVYEKVPLMQGVGLTMLSYAFVFVVSYNQMTSFALYYFFSSMRRTLPWTRCPEEDKIPDLHICTPFSDEKDPNKVNVICNDKIVSYNFLEMCEKSSLEMENAYKKLKDTDCAEPKYNFEFPSRGELCRPREFPSAYFWSHTITRKFRPNDPKYGYLGDFNLPLLGCASLAWFMVYFSLWRGIKGLGCIMYFMTPLPYIVLTVLLCVTLPQSGAMDGVKRFFIPKMESFLDIEVWRVATEQAFYSLGLAMGPWITFGSYSKFESPCHIDAFLICIAVCFTSVLCSTVVFAVVGFLAKKTGRAFEDAVEVGVGLVFIAYPESISFLPGSVFFSLLFYFMLINLAMSSVNGTAETVSSVIYDIWPHTRDFKYLVQLVLCVVWFSLGLPITLRGGLAIYSAVDTFAAGLPLIPMCASELITVIYFYGIGRFCEDLAFMTGYYPNRYYRYHWMVGPFFVLLVSLVGIPYMRLGPEWKAWSLALGWVLFAFVIAPLPVTMVVKYVQYSKRGEAKKVLECPEDYGPPTEQLRKFRALFVTNREIF